MIELPTEVNQVRPLNMLDIHGSTRRIPTPTPNITARSTTRLATPAAMNLGAKTFQTIKCLLNHAALAALPISRTSKYIIIPNAAFKVFRLTMALDSGPAVAFDVVGETFHVASKGLERARRNWGPNVLRMTRAGEMGYRSVEVKRNAVFHWIEDIVDWWPVP